jgi:hypothetical protein
MLIFNDQNNQVHHLNPLSDTAKGKCPHPGRLVNPGTLLQLFKVIVVVVVVVDANHRS